MVKLLWGRDHSSETQIDAIVSAPSSNFGKPLAVAGRYGARAIQLSARLSF
jgi:hypothetical protein